MYFLLKSIHHLIPSILNDDRLIGIARYLQDIQLYPSKSNDKDWDSLYGNIIFSLSSYFESVYPSLAVITSLLQLQPSNLTFPIFTVRFHNSFTPLNPFTNNLPSFYHVYISCNSLFSVLVRETTTLSYPCSKPTSRNTPSSSRYLHIPSRSLSSPSFSLPPSSLFVSVLLELRVIASAWLSTKDLSNTSFTSSRQLMNLRGQALLLLSRVITMNCWNYFLIHSFLS